MKHDINPRLLVSQLHQYIFNDRIRRFRHIFDSISRSEGGLRAVGQLLFELAQSTGVVSGSTCAFRFEADFSGRRLGVCFNPGRGAKLVAPPNPLGFTNTNGGCWLDLQNIAVQNPAEPVYLHCLVGGTRDYVLLPQIRPFAPNDGPHLVIASATHEPQGWRNPSELVNVGLDCIAWAKALPGWTVGFNGEGAGASNRHHWHCQALLCGELPLIAAARRVRATGGSPAIVTDYPICAVAFRGAADQVAREVKATLPGLFALTETGNVLAQQSGSDEMVFVFVPRSTARESVAGPVECRAGFLETGGVLLIKREPEYERIVGAKNPCRLIWEVLSSLEPKGVRETLERWLSNLGNGSMTLVE